MPNFTDNKIKIKKIILIFFMIITVFIIIISRLFYLTVINYKKFNKQDIISLDENRKRINIVDKNNIIVATDVKTKNLYLNKKLLDNEQFIAKNLSKILKLDYKSLYQKITNPNIKSTYILIKKHILPNEENKIRQLPIASLVFEDDLLRFYPHNNLFSHIVGYTDIDENGIIGVEEYYDKYLRNINNEPLKLTLDTKIQEAVRDSLLIAYEKYKVNFIVGIVMEIKTGNVLAMVTLPDFNPNNLSDIKNTFNHATYGNYELGSVFKIFTFANALEEKLINLNSIFDVSKNFIYKDFVIKDSVRVKNKQKITTEEAFAFSSNIATIQIAQKIGIDKQLKFFENLGLLEKIDTDINQTVLPLQPRRWKDINLLTISYGYGLAVSPLHIISATNAIINDGKMITPRFTYNFKSQKKNQIISKETSDLMKRLFRITVEKGTARLANVNGFNVGGKTGTARKISNNEYKQGEYVSSFMGVFPIEDPEYSIFVVADRPQSNNKNVFITGANIAEIVKDIILKTVLFVDFKPGGLVAFKGLEK